MTPGSSFMPTSLKESAREGSASSGIKLMLSQRERRRDRLVLQATRKSNSPLSDHKVSNLRDQNTFRNLGNLQRQQEEEEKKQKAQATRPKSSTIGTHRTIRSKRNYHDLFVQATLARNRGEQFSIE